MTIRCPSKIFFSLILSVILAGVSFLPASAAPAQYLQIGPTKTQLELNPGDIHTGSVKIQNVGEEPLQFSMSVAPFTPVDENYTFDFEHSTDATQLSGWVSLGQTSGTLAPREVKEISYTITVPADAPAGGQYAAILASNLPGDSSTGASIQAIGRVASLLYAKVAGETHECGQITAHDLSSLFFTPPVQATAVVNNCGNVHIGVKQQLRILNPFSGGEIFSTDTSNAETSLVIPGSSRLYTAAWRPEDGAPGFGLFTAEHTIEVPGLAPDTVRKVVLIIPLWLVIALIALIGLCVYRIASSIYRRQQLKKERLYD